MIDWSGTRSAKDPQGALERITRSVELERKSRNGEASIRASTSGNPEPMTGERGGRYTEAVTKEGRKYRRYF